MAGFYHWLRRAALVGIVLSPAANADILNYSPIGDTVLSASFEGNFAALVADPFFAGIQLNSIMLSAAGQSVDLTTAFFGTASFPDPPTINMGPLETRVVSVPIPGSFLPALASGQVAVHVLVTDTDDGLFAIDYFALRVRSATQSRDVFVGSPNGFGIGIPLNGNLPAPLPISIPIDATSTGFDESITSKTFDGVPEPSTGVLVFTIATPLVYLWRRKLRPSH